MKVHLVLTVCAFVCCNGVLEARHAGDHRDFVTHIRKYAPDSDTRPVYVMSIKRPPLNEADKQNPSPAPSPLAFKALKIMSPPSVHLTNREKKHQLRRLPPTPFPNIERLIAKRLKVATYRRTDPAERKKLSKGADVKPTQETIAAIAEPMLATQKYSQDGGYKSSINNHNEEGIRSKDANWPPNPSVYPVRKTSFIDDEEIDALHQINSGSDYLSLFFNQPVENSQKKEHKLAKTRPSQEPPNEEKGTQRLPLFSILSDPVKRHGHRNTPDVLDENRRSDNEALHDKPSEDNQDKDHQLSALLEDPNLQEGQLDSNLNPDRPDSLDQLEPLKLDNLEASGSGYPNKNENSDYHPASSEATEDHQPEYHELTTEYPEKLSSSDNYDDSIDSNPLNVENVENETLNLSPTDSEHIETIDNPFENLEIGTDQPEYHEQVTESNNDNVDETSYQESNNGSDNPPFEQNNPHEENIADTEDFYPHSDENANHPEGESDPNQTNYPDIYEPNHQGHQETPDAPSMSEQEQNPDPYTEDPTMPTYPHDPHYTSYEEDQYPPINSETNGNTPGETEEPDFDAEDQYPYDEDEEVDDDYDEYGDIMDNYYEYYPSPSEPYPFPYRIGMEDLPEANGRPGRKGDKVQPEKEDTTPNAAVGDKDQLEEEVVADNDFLEEEESDPAAATDVNDKPEREETKPENRPTAKPKPQKPQPNKPEPEKSKPNKPKPGKPQSNKPKPAKPLAAKPQSEKPKPEEVDPDVAPLSQEIIPEAQQPVATAGVVNKKKKKRRRRPARPAYRPPSPYYGYDDDDEDDDYDDYEGGTAPGDPYDDDDEDDDGAFYDPGGYYPYSGSEEDYEGSPDYGGGDYDYGSEERRIGRSKRRSRSTLRKRKWHSGKQLSKKLIVGKEAS
ncbi:unnamed protein product [Hermetia illucens]|uniref:Uncharacterized protein n=1 Tax=Hermetia illucens TaxID=343691 RepID=A0A7R8YYU3_HERIL|nr:cell surface glycoprotein 1-like [Hermetia illucens]CAD7089810.1 unnamed protein product [Hermetia illucens]